MYTYIYMCVCVCVFVYKLARVSTRVNPTVFCKRLQFAYSCNCKRSARACRKCELKQTAYRRRSQL